jgi:hypothetical protein
VGPTGNQDDRESADAYTAILVPAVRKKYLIFSPSMCLVVYLGDMLDTAGRFSPEPELLDGHPPTTTMLE